MGDVWGDWDVQGEPDALELTDTIQCIAGASDLALFYESRAPTRQ